jgi:hypothetical protein
VAIVPALDGLAPSRRGSKQHKYPEMMSVETARASRATAKPRTFISAEIICLARWLHLSGTGRTTEMNTQLAVPTTYAIETSGWDANEDFFVEKTSLEWNTSERKIRLQHPVKVGTILFIRLSGIAPLGDSCPVAHQAMGVEYAPETQSYLVHLTQVLPRMHPLGPGRGLKS